MPLCCAHLRSSRSCVWRVPTDCSSAIPTPVLREVIGPSTAEVPILAALICVGKSHQFARAGSRSVCLGIVSILYLVCLHRFQLMLYLRRNENRLNRRNCSDGLECSKRSGGNLHMRCWTAADIAEQEAGENMDVPPPAPSVAFPPFPPVSLPTFPVPMPTFPVPVPMPTFPTNGIDPNNCAREGGRSQQCGASANRAPMCCEGFVCTPGNSKVSHRSVHALLWRSE